MNEFVREITGENSQCQFRFKIMFRCLPIQAPYFSITGESWELGKPRIDKYSISCGALKLKDYLPDLAYLDKYHLMSTKGPMHYIDNSLYHASDRDCWGLRKGEKRQIKNGKTGLLCWHQVAIDEKGNEVDLYRLEKYKDSATQPDNENIRIEWRPLWRIGEGKEPELEAARASACWPDAQLEDFTEEKLLERLPSLIEQFRKDVTEFGIPWPEQE